MRNASLFYQVAGELSKAFETRKRDNGDKFVCLKDGSPGWMTDVIHAAHGDTLPDDTIYSLCEEIADALADADEDADPSEALDSIESDIYTSDLTAWLHARVDHVGYCDEFVEEFGQPKSTAQLLQGGQMMQRNEVGYRLIAALEEEANGRDEDEGDEEGGQDRESYTDDQDRESYTAE